MSFLLKNTIHTSLAETVYNEVLSRRSTYHYFLGRALDWADEETPDTPLATQQYEYGIRNDIIGVKKINVRDVSLVIPRVDWTSGDIYDVYDGNYSPDYTAYSGATSLKESNFYVLTSSYGVFKCLSNNNDGVSTVEPDITDLYPVTYDDGYVWKYMYTIPASLRNKFLTSDYMPVVKSVLTPFYSDGQVDSIVIDNAGSGYSGNAKVELVVYGTFKGGTGNSIANLLPVISNAGQIVDVIIMDAGNNYLTANIAIINNGATGTGYYNTLSTANMFPILYNTKVNRVLIDDPGINYDSNTDTVITVLGDGTGANLTPYINSSGEIEDIVIVDRGTGYSYANITITGSGSGANAYAQLSTGDLNSLQSLVELSSITGGIYSFRIHSGGNGYSHANVTLAGDGSGFIGNAVIVNNVISSITVTSPGTGFTYANVTVTGDGANANISAILPPYHGQGYDPVRELFADTIMFYNVLQSTDKLQGVNIGNDYRQFGIVKDIKAYDTDAKYDEITGSPCYLITLSALGTLSIDETLSVTDESGKNFEIIEIISDTNQVLLSNKNNFALNDNYTLTGPDGFIYTISSIDREPTINKFSGDLLYIDNTTKVTNEDKQIVTLRTVIRL